LRVAFPVKSGYFAETGAVKAVDGVSLELGLETLERLLTGIRLWKIDAWKAFGAFLIDIGPNWPRGRGVLILISADTPAAEGIFKWFSRPADRLMHTRMNVPFLIENC
jgi:hypothetical protein